MVKYLNTVRRYLNTSIGIWVFTILYVNTVVEVFVTTLTPQHHCTVCIFVESCVTVKLSCISENMLITLSALILCTVSSIIVSRDGHAPLHLTMTS